MGALRVAPMVPEIAAAAEWTTGQGAEKPVTKSDHGVAAKRRARNEGSVSGECFAGKQGAGGH